MARGRPTKLTPLLQQKICEALRIGISLEAAATMAGVGRASLHRWMKLGERSDRGRYREFFAAVVKAQADVVTRSLARVQKAIADGDVNSAKWFLERRVPEAFGRKAEHSATGDGGLPRAEMDVGAPDFSKLTDEELDTLGQIYEKLLSRAEPAPGSRIPPVPG